MKIFWSKVNKQGPDDCWDWNGRVGSSGYGNFRTGPRKGLSSGAHRVAWELTYGPIPKGIQVCHKCDRKICCNPKHLFLGTSQDNHDDKVSKDRQAKGESVIHRGEDHPRAKLTDELVRKIRSDPRSVNEISKDYVLDRSCISKVKNFKSWTHIK